MRWTNDRIVWLGVVTAVAALALRVGHVLGSAKLLVADDAVFFEQHATGFVKAWRAIGRPEFAELLRDAVDHASLQGIVYPVFLSTIYGLRGAIDHTAVGLAQAALGAATVWLIFITSRRAFGDAAAVAAGVLAAVYPPLVLTAGLLLAEAALLFLQALAGYLLVRAREPGHWTERCRAGVIVGVLMLRPAFQHAGILTLLGLLLASGISNSSASALRRSFRLALPYIGGLLVIAIPWLLTNGLVFDRFVWSRTGDAWQQVYWGIYPPNRGWWPPDSPVPPKYGVESLPGARASGLQIETHDLDYLDAAIDQVRATPLQALATQVNKLVHGYLYPFNTYAESPPLVAPLTGIVHQGVTWLALVGLALSRRRAPASLALGSLGVAVALPFIVSHIDVRYVVPVALAALPFAGYGVALITAEAARSDRLHRLAAPTIAVASLFIVSKLDVPILLAAMPSLEPLVAHRAHIAATIVALVVAGRAVGVWLGSGVALTVVSIAVATACVIQALYDPGWHEWSSELRPGELSSQRIQLPTGWRPPAGGRAEVRLYAQGAPAQTYTPTVYANGQVIARLGTAFTEGGPLRFEERLMVTARLQGKSRAEVPQWYGVPLDLSDLAGEAIDIRIGLEGSPESWIRVWGDYPASPDQRVLEAPSMHSRIQGQDDSFHKLVSTGHPRLWRRFALASPGSTARFETTAGIRTGDLSRSPGRQSGEFRIRVAIFGPAGDLVTVL